MKYSKMLVLPLCFSLLFSTQVWSSPGAQRQNRANRPARITQVAAQANAAEVSIPNIDPTKIYDNFSSLTPLTTTTSYIAGPGFAVGAIMKFKMHKDNPTQVPIGTPIALVFVAGALLFLPSILNVTNYTIFGSSGGSVAKTGPYGTIDPT